MVSFGKEMKKTLSPLCFIFTNNFHDLESFFSAGEIVDQIGWKVSDDFCEIDEQDEVF